MKLYMLPDVLFDEFPSDDSIKACFFTKPLVPRIDYSRYLGRVTFYCTERTYYVMTSFRKLPFDLFSVMKNKMVILDCQVKFAIEHILTGSPSGSVMFLIDLKDSCHLYTGQFTECRHIFMNSRMENIKIDHLHVDNSFANLNDPDHLDKACTQVAKIIREHRSFKIYLHMEMFGYEDFLVQLARDGHKVKLSELQSMLLGKYHDLFDYEGDPDIRIYPLIREERGLKQRQYESNYNKGIIHIKLVPFLNDVNTVCHSNDINIKGRPFLVSYVPHPDSNMLHLLFHNTRPKFVHPLVPQGYNYDPVSIIPSVLLHDECTIINDEIEPQPDYDCYREDYELIGQSAADETAANLDSFLKSEEMLDVSGDLSSVDGEDTKHNDSKNGEPTPSTSGLNKSLNETEIDDEDEEDVDEYLENLHRRSINLTYLGETNYSPDPTERNLFGTELVTELRNEAQELLLQELQFGVEEFDQARDRIVNEFGMFILPDDFR